MTKLQSLELSDRNWSGSGEGVLFSSLEPLSGLTSLTRLTVRSSLVTDLTPLSGLENLQSPDLKYLQCDGPLPPVWPGEIDLRLH